MADRGDRDRERSHQRNSASMGMSSSVRTPSASTNNSPTDATGLSRRLSWNSGGEAISMRDLTGSVIVGSSRSGAGPEGGGPSGFGAGASEEMDEYDLGVRQPRGSPSFRMQALAPINTTMSRDTDDFGAGSGMLGGPGDGPVPFNSLGSQYSASLHEGNVFERLTPEAPDHSTRPGSKRVSRVYDTDGHARHSPLNRIARSPTVRRVSNTLRIASERVVNIMGSDKGSPATGGYANLTRINSDDDSPLSEVASNPLPLHDSPATPPGPVKMYPTQQSSYGLRGRTLGFFSASNPLRRTCDRILRFPWTEPIILMLILFNAVVLTIQSAPPLFTPRPPGGYFRAWEDYALFALFIVFTVEMFARMIVTGLLIDPETDTRAWFAQKWSILMRRAKAEDDPTQAKMQDSWQRRRRQSTVPMPGKLKRNLTAIVGAEAPFQEAVARQHDVLAQNRPYLRHSWHRIDLLAILMFWITFIVSMAGAEITDKRHLYIFRALSVLRATRLLVITSGTATILHSLKRAGPLILNVSVFIIFAAALFSIIGVQSFRGSLRRTCVLLASDPSENTYLNNTCGGWIDPQTLKTMPFFKEDGQLTTISPKGFLCPIGQECHTVWWSQESNSESFDNIFMSLVQVLVIAGVNTWTDTMYNIMSAEFFSSSLFFIVAIIVLNFWLMNLLVAVVVNTFKDIRAETKKSAFGADDVMLLHQPEWAAGAKKPREQSKLLKWYLKTQLIWSFLVVVDIMAQAFKHAESSPSELSLLRHMELGFALMWDVEILIRIAAFMPDWQAFLRSGRNDFDLFLAVACSIIQIPPIRNSTIYPWLTVFQMLRWYRFVIVFPRMKPLLANVFGSFAGMLNMVLFLFMMNFLSALMALQLLRGDTSEGTGDMIDFSQTYNSFLGMYQIFSTENWTDVLYGAMKVEWGWGQGWIVCIFLMIWFMFANFILMQMFIAVINENFELAEELKRKEQIEAFVRKTEPKSTHVNWIDRFNPYRLIRARHKAVKVDQLPPNLILPLKQNIGADVGAPQYEPESKGTKAVIRHLFGLENMPESFQMRSLTTNKMSTNLRSSSAVDVNQDFDDDYDDDRGLTDLLPPINAGPSVDEHMDAMRERRNQQADFISAHPSFDKSLWIFSQSNPIRQVCQMIVPPAHGERIYGRPANHLLSLAFRILLFLAVIASIVVFGIATPHYRRGYYEKYGEIRATWFDMTEMALGCLFVIEALIKIIADGFIFTPNAYLLSLWNLVDFVILITIVVNTICSFAVVGGVSRATRAMKAFRALRLVTLFSRLRDTFHAVFFAGALRIVDASILMILYLIPFAVWGLNIFSGRLASCNDSDNPDSPSNRDGCVSEYYASPVGDLEFLAPRVWANPQFGGSVWSFDSFRESMLILFEIVSLEGWTDVMSSAMNIVGLNQQPDTNNQQWNSIFFVIFNLFGGVIILTVFLSIIIENFSIRAGSALLTTEQNQWLDLAKFIRQQAPSQLPRNRPRFGFRAWCYDRAVDKRGWWTRGFTVLYFVHIILLMMEDYSNNIMTEEQLDWVFLTLTVLYAIDLVVRFVGLGFHSFRSNGWNLFDVVVITGSFVTTIPALQASMRNEEGNQASKQVQKLFLVSVALKLVQRLDSLNQLFKTAIASLPAIGNLFLLWAVVFIFYAIVMMEIFGLTKMGNNADSVYQNYHNMGNALVMLAFMSTGEGWNGYMHDYTVEYPRCTNDDHWLNNDCGSVGWAYVLFIFWNILSMYIFLNMFTGVVVQSFAYVYQSPGGASLTREQIRSFKRVWAEIDKDRTGYIRRKDFTRFFSKLTGVFEVRLYPIEFSVPNLLRSTVPDPDTPAKRIETGVHYSIDVRKLRQQIAQIDYTKVRERRRLYVRLFNEAKMSEEPGRGISFTSMLMMLAHYKLIDDEKALQVDELLLRRAKMERVEDLVNLDRVRGLLRTIYWRRRFLRTRLESRILAAQQDGIPAIVLDPTNPDEDGDPLQAGTMYHTPSVSATTMGMDRAAPASDALPPFSRAPHTPPRAQHVGDYSFGTVDAGNLSVSSVGSAFGQHANTSLTSYTTALSAPGASGERRGSLDSRASSEGTFRQWDSMYESDREDELMSAMATSAWASMMRDAEDEEGDD